LKDEDGGVLDWDQAIEYNKPLAEYVKRYPNVADAAKAMLHRNRNIGQHAGGVIISNVPIADIVPLVRGKDGRPSSAWVEGLSGQDLSKVGFVKLDFLAIEANTKKERNKKVMFVLLVRFLKG